MIQHTIQLRLRFFIFSLFLLLSINGCGSNGEGGSTGSNNTPCTPGTTQACYTGPAGTQNVGICKDGTQTCKADGSGYEACQNEVLPAQETCGNNIDEDCTGADLPCPCVPNTNESCYTGPAGTEGKGICKTGIHHCYPDGTYSDCNNILPVQEICGNNIDEDCTGADLPCVCNPGDTKVCYEGAANTQNVGVCQAGISTCNAQGTAFGSCIGQILPSPENCQTPGDDDCNGQTNEGGQYCNCQPGSQQSCYSGPPPTKNTGLCNEGQQVCNAAGNGFGPCMGEVLPVAENCQTMADDDCDGKSTNDVADGCVCAPNVPVACYEGPAGTQGVGLCQSGISTCNVQGTAFGPCVGQVTPVIEDCASAQDEDCDGNSNCLGAFLWGKSYGDTSNQGGTAVATAANQDVVLVGYYNQVVDFGGTAGSIQGALSADGFVTRFSQSGDAIWVRAFGDSEGLGMQQVLDVAVDSPGNSVMVGSFSWKFDTGSGNILVGAGNYDAFIVKLGADGSYQWAKNFGDSLNQLATSVLTLPNQDIVFAGQFFGTIDFGLGPLNAGAYGSIFLTKLDSGGSAIFNKVYSHTQFFNSFFDSSLNLALNKTNDRIAMIGSFGGAIQFDPNAPVLTGSPTPSTKNGFLVVFDPNANQIFAKSIGVAVEPQAVAFDSNGDVFVGGFFNGTVDFGQGPVTSQDIDAFLIQYSSNGALIWSKTFGGIGEQKIIGLDVDSADKVVFSGHFSDAIDVGGGSFVSAGGLDIFVAKLDNSGNVLWSHHLGGLGDQLSRQITVDGLDRAIFTGLFKYTLGIGIPVLLTSAGNGFNNNIFLLQFQP